MLHGEILSETHLTQPLFSVLKKRTYTQLNYLTLLSIFEFLMYTKPSPKTPQSPRQYPTLL